MAKSKGQTIQWPKVKDRQTIQWPKVKGQTDNTMAKSKGTNNYLENITGTSCSINGN